MIDLKWSFQRRQTRRYDAQAATSSRADWLLTSGCCGEELTALLPPEPLPDGRLGLPSVLLLLLLPLTGELAASSVLELLTAVPLDAKMAVAA